MKVNKQAHFAKKSLGQNFLQDGYVLEQIADAAQVSEGDRVLEIGPGLGALTRVLLGRGAHITAVEFDPRAVEYLAREWKDNEHLVVLPASILDVHIDTVFASGNWCVAANIPYHITNPIIRKLLYETKNRPTSCTLMVQKEVAQKIAKKSKGSLLQKMVENWAVASIVCTVPRTAFVPVPRVDSAVLQLEMRDEPLMPPHLESAFFTVLKAGFSQKRKKIKTALAGALGDLAAPLLVHVDPSSRAEEISMATWRTLAEEYVRLTSEA